MAVYKRTYRGYTGALTAEWSRFLVLYQYSRRSLFQSKWQTTLFNLCFFFPLLSLLGIYANDHLAALGIGGITRLFTVDGSFFTLFLGTQASFSFVLTAFLGPGLISPDLANGGLTLFLCRPLSRAEYILGKMSVIAITLSWITWVPGLVLFFVQGSLAGPGWMAENYWIAIGILLGSLLWIGIVSLIALALSAWVKWRLAAGALLLAVFFVGAGFAQAINHVLQTQQGYLIDIREMVAVVWRDLLRDEGTPPISAGEAWVGLFLVAGFCLWLLMKKVKANEVVR